MVVEKNESKVRMNPLIRQIMEWPVALLPDKAQYLLTRYGLYAVTGLGLWKIPVVVLRGPLQPSGQIGSLLVAGHDPWVGYLPHRFFVGDPQRERVGNVRIGDLPALLHRMGGSVDLTIVRVDRLSARKFLDHDYLVVPEWVGMRLRVPEDLDGLVRGNHSIREDMRLARRHKLYPLVTEGAERFDEFYDCMYVPFSRARHGKLAVVKSRHELRQQLRNGGILWVMRENIPLASMIFKRKKQVLDMEAIGMAMGELPLKMRGIMAALYYFNIAYARRLGCTEVDFRGARPSLHDGLVRYKRKWGNILYDKSDSYYDLLVRWNAVNGVVKDFLSHTSLIFREAEGLSAITTDNSQSRRSLWIGGLHRLLVLTESGRQPMIDGNEKDPLGIGGCEPKASPYVARRDQF